MKTLNNIIIILILLFAVGCSSQQPVVPLTTYGSEPEAMANCIEDQMDSIRVPEGLDDYESIDYRENQAELICKGLQDEKRNKGIQIDE